MSVRPNPAVGESPGAVLFVSHSAIWGGAERVLVDTAGAFDCPPVVLCPRGQLADQARAAGLHVLSRSAHPPELRGGARVRARAMAGLAAHALEIRMLLQSLRPRAVVAFGMRSAIGCAAALRTVSGAPPLVFEHVDYLPGHGAAWLVRAAAARAHRVVALSNSVAADLDPRGRLGERLRVAAPGVDVDSFTATPPPERPPVAIVLGAVVAWKRPDLALEAVAAAAQELPDLRLVVAGHTVGEDGQRLLESLRRRAAQPDLAGRVEFPGVLPDPRAALAEASCLLHCADREPFGLVLLEAMACGRPVVAPSAGGPLEIVADGCGRLFAPGDACAAAAALVEILAHPDRLRYGGRRARARAVADFSLEAARTRWLHATGLTPAGASNSEPGRGLTLVTVSHDSQAELELMLGSVARHLPAAQVLVVDAGSSDDSAAVARGWADRVRVLELENVGYGRAANVGVKHVGTAVCAILNPDTELVDDSLAALAAEVMRPGAPKRLLAPLVLRPDGTRQDSAHPEPVSAEAVICALLPPAALLPPLKRRVQPWRGARPRRVAWAVGCCVVAATDTLRRLGPFDERIFMYGEDLELGLRARDTGVETWWWPHARLVHHGAHAAQRVFGGEPIEVLARQRHAVVAERRGEQAARWDDRLQTATFANRIALKTLLRRTTERERRQLRAVRQSAGSRLAKREVGPRMHA